VVFVVLLTGVCAHAQQSATHTNSSSAVQEGTQEMPGITAQLPLRSRTEAPLEAPHAFWNRKNALLFTGVGLARGLDFASTLNMRARGRDEIMLSNWVVDNRPLFAGVEAAGTGASIGLSYLMHRTGHHKLEHWISVGHITGATFGSVRNYCLDSHHVPQ
jgi:hypothetical protein